MKIEEFLALGLSDRIWMRNLPPLLAEVMRAAGLEAALKFGLHFGGMTNVGIPRTQYVHQAPKGVEKWQLTKIVGEDAALKIAEHFGRGHGYSFGTVPVTLHGKFFRRLLAFAMFERHATVSEICQSVGVTRSTVYEWRKVYEDILSLSSEINFEAGSKPVDTASASVADDGGSEA